MPITHFPNGISNYGVPVYGAYIPPIIGTYYHICPGSGSITNGQGQMIIGSDGNDGLTPQTSLASINAAYNKCVDGAGDGIIIWGYGNLNTNNNGMLPIQSTLYWNKSNITLVGICPPTHVGQESGIYCPNTTTGVQYSVVISGSYNNFINIRIKNDSNNGFGALSLMGGSMNNFNNVHIDGTSNPSSVSSYNSCSAYLDGSKYNKFSNCSFGSLGTPWPGTAPTGQIKIFNQFVGPNDNNFFENCKIYSSYIGTESSAIDLKYSTSGLLTVHEFSNCSFINSPPSTFTGRATYVVLGASATETGEVLISGNTSVIGYLGYAAQETSQVFVSAPISSAIGGIAISTP
jgi:hypothetical protein